MAVGWVIGAEKEVGEVEEVGEGAVRVQSEAVEVSG